MLPADIMERDLYERCPSQSDDVKRDILSQGGVRVVLFYFVFFVCFFVCVCEKVALRTAGLYY